MLQNLGSPWRFQHGFGLARLHFLQSEFNKIGILHGSGLLSGIDHSVVVFIVLEEECFSELLT